MLVVQLIEFHQLLFPNVQFLREQSEIQPAAPSFPHRLIHKTGHCGASKSVAASDRHQTKAAVAASRLTIGRSVRIGGSIRK
jgi:hypothetical protein